MAYNVPSSSQWITFPSKPSDATWITWADDRNPQRALYYFTKCYWGYLNGEPPKLPAPPASNNPQPQQPPKVLSKPVTDKTNAAFSVLATGEADLFIAAEYVESQYRGGPITDFHISDLADVAPNGSQPGMPWIRMQLNECVHYGQAVSANTKSRWLVYHPPIAMGVSAPDMFQHRFTDTAVTNFAKKGAAALLSHVPIVGFASGMAEIGADSAKSYFGHKLNQFLGTTDLVEAQSRQYATSSQLIATLGGIQQKAGMYATGRLEAYKQCQVHDPEADWLRLTAIQRIEDLRADAQRQTTDTDVKARFDEHIATETAKMKRETVKQGYFSRLANFFSGKSPNDTQGVREMQKQLKEVLSEAQDLETERVHGPAPRPTENKSNSLPSETKINKFTTDPTTNRLYNMYEIPARKANGSSTEASGSSTEANDSSSKDKRSLSSPVFRNLHGNGAQNGNGK